MSDIDESFHRRISVLDLSLFKEVPTQSLDGDRRSWLAVQRSIRSPAGYTYLEVGSHLGGSIQQYLVDPWCVRIVSIDKRPIAVPHIRGRDVRFEGNSTDRMLENLGRIAPDRLSKLICFDSDVREVDPSSIPARADVCFIDGEHTRAAVVSDFEFCLGAAAPNAAIYLHDDATIWIGLLDIVSSLRRRRIPFSARKLEGLTFAIFLRDCPSINDPYIRIHSQSASAWFLRRRIRHRMPPPLRFAARSISSMLTHLRGG